MTLRSTIFKRSAILAGMVVAVVDGFAASVMIPLLPDLSDRAGVAPGQWVFILGVNGVLLTFAPMIWGRVINPANTSRIVAGTLIVKACCMAALCLPQSFLSLMLNRALSGAMCGTPIAVQSAMVGETRHEDGAAFSVAWFNIATAAGFALGAMAASVVLRHDLAFTTLALTTTAALCTLALVAMVVWKPYRESVAQRADKQVSPEPASRHRYLAVLAIVAGARVASAAYPVLLLMAAEHGEGGLSLPIAAILVGWISLIEIFSQIVVPFVIARVGLFATNVSALVCLGAGMGLAAALLSPRTASVATMLIGLGGGALRTSLMSWVLKLGAGQIARSAGANFGVNGAARALAPVAAGALFNIGATVAFASFAALPPILVLLTFWMKRERPAVVEKEQ